MLSGPEKDHKPTVDSAEVTRLVEDESLGMTAIAWHLGVTRQSVFLVRLKGAA